ncbi:MAG: PAS domain-containing protein [Myxococcales bacterium]|nr:PAS domain-containing protein [Myxococcales bacterium]
MVALPADFHARLLEGCPHGVVVYRADNEVPTDLVITYANPRADAIVGLPLSTLTGKTIGEVFPTTRDIPEAIEVAVCIMRVALDEEAAVMRSVPNYEDETIRHYDLHCTPLGERLTAVFFEDVTARLKAEAQARLQAKVIDNTPIGLFAFRVEGTEQEHELRVVLANPAAAALSRFDHDTAMGMSLADVFSTPADSPNLLRLADAVLHGEANEWHSTAAPPGGEVRHWQVRVFPVDAQHGGVAYADVTAEVETASTLARRTSALERSNRDLEEFAYVASHDLQEPLRMITGFGKLLESRYQDELDERGRRYLSHMVDGAGRMHQLISDLLRFSRLNTEAAPLVATDANDALEQALAGLHTALTETQAQVERAPLPTLPFNPSQLVQLFQNLIGNAVKYRSSAPPVVRISAIRDGHELIFAVADNGIGIATQYQKQVFEIFRRLHSREDYSGTGIGLSICKRIVERHGGRIWLESTLGEGTTVYFALPTEPISPDESAA